MKGFKAGVCTFVGMVALAAAPKLAHALTVTVTTANDVVATDGVCSLREAIQAARTGTTVDTCVANNLLTTIQLGIGTYKVRAASLGTLTLGGLTTIVGQGYNRTNIVLDPSEGTASSASLFTVPTGSLTSHGPLDQEFP